MVLTEKGFNRPTFDELLNRQVMRARQLFGEDIDTDSHSALGKYLRINAYDLAECYELLEDIYYARFPNSARGQSLDRLCTFAGVVRNPGTAARIKVKFIGKVGATIDAGSQLSAGNITFYVGQDSTIGSEGVGTGEAFCTELGSMGNVSLRDGLVMVNPLPDVESVLFLEIIDDGQDRENDTSLRFRFGKSVAGSGSGTVDAITGAISRVALVEGVALVENDTEGTVEGRPPHSFECFVLAPESQDLLIAEAIFSKKPLGIKSYGSIEVEVRDKALKLHKVYFSRTLKKTVYIHASVKINQFFESGGTGQIKDSLVDYINNLANGESVYISSLYGHIHSVHGVVNVQKLELSEDGISFAVKDIKAEANEIVRVLAENIELEVVV